MDGPIPKPFSKTRDWPLEHSEIISTPEGKTLHRLPGDNWRAFFWTKNNAELWGVVMLLGLPRADILRYNLIKNQTTAIRLDTSDKTVSYSVGAMFFKFSPDGRWLAASMSPNSRVVWDTETGKIVKSVNEGEDASYYAYKEPQFSSDSQTLLIPTPEGIKFHHLPQRKTVQ